MVCLRAASIISTRAFAWVSERGSSKRSGGGLDGGDEGLSGDDRVAGLERDAAHLPGQGSGEDVAVADRGFCPPRRHGR